MPDPLYYSALAQSQQHAADHNLTGLAIGAVEAALSGRAAESEHWHTQLAKALFLESEFDEAESAVDRESITRPTVKSRNQWEAFISAVCCGV